MQILPVLDLQGGGVVRGVAGRRHEYRPLVSRLIPSPTPLTAREAARAIRAHFGLNELYLADLDAIAGAPPRLADLAELVADGFQLWVDAGVRQVEQARPLAQLEGVQVVVGLETVAGPAALAECIQELPGRLVFSLDLRDGIPLGSRAAWDDADGSALAARAIEMGVERLLVLDLARVGGGNSTGTEELCRQLARQYPRVILAAGGGIRGRADLERLGDSGVKIALVASALHEGRLTREELEGL